MREKILGVNVDFVNRQEAVKRISSWIEYSEKQPIHQVVTAYSEFLVKARSDEGFKKVINEADLVTPDGVSVLAAGAVAGGVVIEAVTVGAGAAAGAGADALI